MGVSPVDSAVLDLSVRLPPRRYQVGTDGWVTISDCGTVRPAPGQAVAVRLTSADATLTVTRRDWGFEVSLPSDSADAVLEIAGRAADRLHLMLRTAAGAQAFDDYLAREEIGLRAPLEAVVP